MRPRARPFPSYTYDPQSTTKLRSQPTYNPSHGEKIPTTNLQLYPRPYSSKPTYHFTIHTAANSPLTTLLTAYNPRPKPRPSHILQSNLRPSSPPTRDPGFYFHPSYPERP